MWFDKIWISFGTELKIVLSRYIFHSLSSSNPTRNSHLRNYFRTLVKSLNAAPFILFYVIFYLWEIKPLLSLVFAYCLHYASLKKNILKYLNWKNVRMLSWLICMKSI